MSGIDLLLHETNIRFVDVNERSGAADTVKCKDVQKKGDEIESEERPVSAISHNASLTDIMKPTGNKEFLSQRKALFSQSDT